MIRGKFLAQDDFDLAGHRFLNWQWIADLPTREGEEGQTVAIVGGVAKWASLSADGLVVVKWADVLNKPTEFTPEEHTHPWDEVTGTPATYPPDVHTHSYTGLDETLQETLDFFVGAVLGDITVDVTSDGADIILTLTGELHGGPLKLLYNADGSGAVDFDTSTADPVTLTPGDDDDPELNYIWIPSDTQVLTTGTAWPTDIDYVPIATVMCQSAASAQTYGLYKVHAWTDHTHTEDRQGHLGHINAWIRTQPATWRSGVAITPTLGADQFDIANTAGVVLQLHDHVFPAFTTIGGSEPLYVINDPVTSYKRVANLSAEHTDSASGSLSNRYYSVVVWGVVSEDAEDCKLIINLPSGSYNAAAGAQADTSGYADYGIPADYAGVGFLIYRLVVRHQVAGNTFTLVEAVDLRGTFPGGFTGSSSGSGDHGALIGLTDPDHPLTALQAGAASEHDGIVLSGATWTAAPVFRIAPSAIVTDFTIGTPTFSHVIVIESTGGAQRYTALALLPVSVATQTALDLKEDTLAAYDTVPTDSSTNIVESNGVFDALATKAAVAHTHSLTDMEQSGATTGQVVTWNNTSGEWEPADAAAGGGGGLMARMFYIESMSSTDDYPLWVAANTLTISRVTAFTADGLATFDLVERAGGAPDTGGTDITASVMLAFTTEQVITSFSNAGIAARAWVCFSASSVTGPPSKSWITVEYTED